MEVRIDGKVQQITTQRYYYLFNLFDSACIKHLKRSAREREFQRYLDLGILPVELKTKTELKPKPELRTYILTDSVDENRLWISNTMVVICRYTLNLPPVKIEWFRLGYAGKFEQSFTYKSGLNGLVRYVAPDTIRLRSDLSHQKLASVTAHECRHLWQEQKGMTYDIRETDARQYEKQARADLKDYLRRYNARFNGPVAQDLLMSL